MPFFWEYFKFRVRGLPTPDPATFAFLKPGMLVFDVGANLGNYSQVFLDRQARVVAIEPQSYCCRFMRRRFAGRADMTVLRCGAGAESGTREMLISSAHVLSSFNRVWVDRVNKTSRFGGNRIVWQKREQAEIVTLDQLVERYGTPNYIKIDVEGLEQEVLRGLHHSIDYVSFEFTLPELPHDAIACIRLLMANGAYEFRSLLNTGEESWISAEAIERELRELSASGRLHNGDVFARRQSAITVAS